MGADERPDLVSLIVNWFVPGAGAAELGWLCLSTRLSWEVPIRRMPKLVFEFDTKLADFAQNSCAVLAKRFYCHFFG